MNDLDEQHHSPDREDASSGTPWRKRVMRASSQASAEELAQGVASLGDAEGVTNIREPETGLVMLRGRMGGDGRPFNFGEATVTRAVVKLHSGEIGFSYLLGRSKTAARHAAVLDAFAQRKSDANELETNFVAIVENRVSAEVTQRAQKTDATRVDFFTLVRGED